MFMKYRIFYLWDAQNPENKKVLRQARKVVDFNKRIWALWAPGALDHGPYRPQGLGPNHFSSLSQNYFVFSRILGVPKIKSAIVHENRRSFADFCYFGKC